MMSDCPYSSGLILGFMLANFLGPNAIILLLLLAIAEMLYSTRRRS